MVRNIQQAIICEVYLNAWRQEISKKEGLLQSLDVHCLFFSEVSKEEYR